MSRWAKAIEIGFPGGLKLLVVEADDGFEGFSHRLAAGQQPKDFDDRVWTASGGDVVGRGKSFGVGEKGFVLGVVDDGPLETPEREDFRFRSCGPKRRVRVESVAAFSQLGDTFVKPGWAIAGRERVDETMGQLVTNDAPELLSQLGDSLHGNANLAVVQSGRPRWRVGHVTKFAIRVEGDADGFFGRKAKIALECVVLVVESRRHHSADSLVDVSIVADHEVELAHFLEIDVVVVLAQCLFQFVEKPGRGLGRERELPLSNREAASPAAVVDIARQLTNTRVVGIEAFRLLELGLRRA